MTAPDQYASVRYLVNDVQATIDFYTTHLGFTLNTSAAPAFADVVRGPLRLLLSGPASFGARATPTSPQHDPDGCDTCRRRWPHRSHRGGRAVSSAGRESDLTSPRTFVRLWVESGGAVRRGEGNGSMWAIRYEVVWR